MSALPPAPPIGSPGIPASPLRDDVEDSLGYESAHPYFLDGSTAPLAAPPADGSAAA